MTDKIEVQSDIECDPRINLTMLTYVWEKYVTKADFNDPTKLRHEIKRIRVMIHGLCILSSIDTSEPVYEELILLRDMLEYDYYA